MEWLWRVLYPASEVKQTDLPPRKPISPEFLMEAKSKLRNISELGADVKKSQSLYFQIQNAKQNLRSFSKIPYIQPSCSDFESALLFAKQKLRHV